MAEQSFPGAARGTPPPGYEEFDPELDTQEERLERNSRGDAGRFLESDDIGRVRGFLEDQLRVRPLPTLLAAVVVGWLAGKLLK